MLKKLIVDVECYRNYFLALFKEVDSDSTYCFELYDGCELDCDALSELMSSNRTISFNGNGYDLYMISAAIDGRDNEWLKRFSDAIILSDAPSWKVANMRDVYIPRNQNGKPDWDHIDLIEVAPGKASLKIYGGRLNAPKLQDLPIKPDAIISPEQRKLLRDYCLNDLETTELLFKTLTPQLQLRVDMSKQYRLDLRSKSDAQIAEAVFRKEIGNLEGRQIIAPKVDMTKRYRYNDPKIISFNRPDLKAVLDRLIESAFPLAASGSIDLPSWLKDTKIKIGNSEYQMGIGGLHSCEKRRHIVCAEDHVLRDADVASYYPSIILQQGLVPENLGMSFSSVYSDIYRKRLEHKHMASVCKSKLDSLTKELELAKSLRSD